MLFYWGYVLFIKVMLVKKKKKETTTFQLYEEE